jgi:hypothetical protein
MPKGKPRGSAENALIRSAELIGWALGGIEREIFETRARLAALTTQATRLRKQAGRKAVQAADTAAQPKAASGRRRRRMSAEGRKRIAEAAKRRWAKWRADKKER